MFECVVCGAVLLLDVHLQRIQFAIITARHAEIFSTCLEADRKPCESTAVLS